MKFSKLYNGIEPRIVNLVRLYMSAEGITERVLLIFTEIKVVWALLGSKCASQ